MPADAVASTSTLTPRLEVSSATPNARMSPHDFAVTPQSKSAKKTGETSSQCRRRRLDELRRGLDAEFGAGTAAMSVTDSERTSLSSWGHRLLVQQQQQTQSDKKENNTTSVPPINTATSDSTSNSTSNPSLKSSTLEQRNRRPPNTIAANDEDDSTPMPATGDQSKSLDRALQQRPVSYNKGMESLTGSPSFRCGESSVGRREVKIARSHRLASAHDAFK